MWCEFRSGSAGGALYQREHSMERLLGDLWHGRVNEGHQRQRTVPISAATTTLPYSTLRRRRRTIRKFLSPFCMCSIQTITSFCCFAVDDVIHASSFLNFWIVTEMLSPVYEFGVNMTRMTLNSLWLQYNGRRTIAACSWLWIAALSFTFDKRCISLDVGSEKRFQ